MKRIALVLTSVLFASILVGCGETKKEETNTTTTVQQPADTTTPAPDAGDTTNTDTSTPSQ